MKSKPLEIRDKAQRLIKDMQHQAAMKGETISVRQWFTTLSPRDRELIMALMLHIVHETAILVDVQYVSAGRELDV